MFCFERSVRWTDCIDRYQTVLANSVYPDQTVPKEQFSRCSVLNILLDGQTVETVIKQF